MDGELKASRSVRFALGSVAVTLVPLALVTAFFALTPTTLGNHLFAVLGVCVTIGLIATMPVRVTPLGLFARGLYALVMCCALTAWMFFVLSQYFPENASLVFRHFDL